ncbi:TonB-linked outer membrane protein, SusC/RagA family [Algibacter lectus]|uniref:SusC/RagA family TonB-linked outer membrane protein n=1 Tax=Algibacter lectus TaxID=221126 RepID=UPI0008F22820|nr:TonB-dependent receptor [Algibacter lectus]SFD09516.1 TonB-linked outer membrane protein, SusC/RagA family [Algibacter lectus]
MMKKIKNQTSLKKPLSLFWMIAFLVCSMTNVGYANTNPTNEQNKTITGTVISAEDNMGIPGVNVIVKGTSTGAVTDFDGNYSITVPSNSSVLSFSYIGYSSKEVTVGSNSTINVTLELDVAALDEVIVVGFGTQKKATLTGAVTQVKGDDVFKGKGTSSAALALQGEVPGLVVTRTSSRPGNDGANIQIRGDISVNNIGPLILLDGLEIAEWQLATINANDIESYSVLKDGAAAIFGTKAAGGVILVTTKKGKQGKMKVNYKAETQMNFAGDMPVSSLKDWGRLWLLAGENDTFGYTDGNGVAQQATGTYRFFTQEETQDIVDGTYPLAPESVFWLGKDHRLDDVNQYDAVYGTTISERHDLSLSGGSENATYRTSFGYANERSPISFVYDGAKRYNFRTNLTYKMSDMVKTDFSVSYDSRKVDEPTQGVGHGVQDMYLFPLYNPQGQYYDIFGANNLLAKLDEGGRTVNREEIFRLGAKITLDLNQYVEGLSLTYNGNMSSRNGTRMERTTSVTMYDWDGNVSSTPTSLLNSGVKYFDTDIRFQNHVLQANYLKSIGKHNFGVLVGTTAEQQQINRAYTARTNMLSDELDDINTGDITTQVTGGSPKQSNGSTFNSGSEAVGLISYIGKFNYDYNGIYLLEALGRRDGSSRLDPDYRWKNFFSASGGVRLSELSFVNDLNIFNNLKIRASYGETGSVTGIGAYDYLSSINTSSTIFGAAPSLANTAWVAGLTTTQRSWERVATTNYGLDFTILDNRLSGTAEVFHRENNDMLVQITYPQIGGFSAPDTNSGDFVSDGYELSLNWRDQIGDFKYRVGVMFWDSKSEVARMEGQTAITYGVNQIVEGDPLNAIYAYKTDGLFQNEEDILDYYNQVGFSDVTSQSMKSGSLLPAYRSANRLTPGSVKRVDVNGDDTITTDDLVYVGDANAHNSYSFSLGLEYKGFDFSAFFQGVGKQNIVRDGALAYPFRSWWTNQNPTYLTSSWTPENTSASNPVISYNGQRNNWNYRHINDINVIKASYLRAKVLSLGYTLPQDILERVGLDRIRLSLTGNDLFVIDNIKDGFDPEKGDSAGQGSTVPYTSTMVLGLEITF